MLRTGIRVEPKQTTWRGGSDLKSGHKTAGLKLHGPRENSFVGDPVNRDRTRPALRNVLGISLINTVFGFALTAFGQMKVIIQCCYCENSRHCTRCQDPHSGVRRYRHVTITARHRRTDNGHMTYVNAELNPR